MKIQITAILSADGYLWENTDSTHHSAFRSGKYGLERLKEYTLPLSPHSSLIDLLDERRQGSDASYLAEATPETMELVKGLLLYRLADEIVLYMLPHKQEKGIQLTGHIVLSEWELTEDRPLKSGIRRKTYRRKG